MGIHATFGALAGVDLDATTTDRVFSLGDRVCASDGSVYEYIRADEALTQYAALKVDDDGECSMINTAISGAEPTRVACCQVAFADTEYGWAIVSGSGTMIASSGDANANVKLYTTGTPGEVADTAADLIAGLKATTAESGGTIPFFASTYMATNHQD